MRLFERVLLPVGGAALVLGVVFFVVYIVLPQRTVEAPVIPSEPGGEQDLANIVVAQPVSGEEIGFPLVIAGQARVFENTLSYRVLDDAGTVLAEGNILADAQGAGQFGSFALSINYLTPTTSSGVVEVFSLFAKDGTQENGVTIPVVFPKDEETENVSVYFIDRASAQTSDCSVTHAVTRRIVNTPAIAHATLQELFAGPLSSESQTLETMIPSSAKLRSVIIEDGVATVTFVQGSFSGVAGSCTVGAIRAQIEQTLLQFSSVTSVVLLEEGTPANEILQP